MIDLAVVKKISNGHGSFSIWREGDIDDTSIIQEEVNKLHGRAIFIGYNASADILPFQNFHKTHVGGRDGWLAESIGRHPVLRGAYMTDFFKGDYAVQETGVENSSETIQKNLEILNKEIAIFEKDKPVLITFGDKTFNLIKSLGFDPKYLPHYARHGLTKNEFCRLVNEI